MRNKKNLFRSSSAAPFLALTAAFVWGAAYPFIKLGMEEFSIGAGDTAAKTLFAGIRFTIAGLVVLIAAYGSGQRARMQKGAFPGLLLFALINTALHYFCFYVGLSHSPGSRASVLNSLGTFLLVLLSVLFFAEEHLTKYRIMGCLVGFAGLFFLNLTGEAGGAFTFLGDGMILLNGVCAAFGGILTRIVGKKMNPLIMTGGGLFLGGLMLIAAGLLTGGRILVVTPLGLAELAVLVGISTIGFSIYNQLLQYHPVGKIGIYNSTIPVFGILLSCLLLGEAFHLRYGLAALLVAFGVILINREDGSAQK